MKPKRPGLESRRRRVALGMSDLPKTKVLASAVSAVLGTSLIHSTAFAQDIEEITVTGSRIVRRDLVSASPLCFLRFYSSPASLLVVWNYNRFGCP